MKMVDAGKTRTIGLPYGENGDDMLSRFHLIPERHAVCMLDSIKSICASQKDKTHLDISEFLLAPTSNGCVSNRD